MLLKNSCEFFNNYVLDTRKLLILIVAKLQYKPMGKLHTRRDLMKKQNGKLCPKIEEKFQKLVSSCSYLQQVKYAERQFMMDIKRDVCRQCDISGIRCVHELISILKEEDKFVRLISHSYIVDPQSNDLFRIRNSISIPSKAINLYKEKRRTRFIDI